MSKETRNKTAKLPNQARSAMPGGGPGHGAFGVVEKPKNFRKTIKDLIAYMRPFWARIIFVFIFAVASTIFAIVGPKILGKMTNQVVSDYIKMTAYDQVTAKLPENVKYPEGTTIGDIFAKMPSSQIPKIAEDKLDEIKSVKLSSRPKIDFGRVEYLGLFLLGLYLISSALSYVQGWMMSFISQRITYQFRKDISEKINRLPLRYFDRRTHGEVLSRVTNDVDTVSQTLNQSLTQIVTSITMIIGILIMMLTISWLMTLVAMVILPLGFLVVGLILKKSQGYFKKQQDYLGQINGHVEEMYSGHTVMKVFNGEKKSVARFSNINHELYDSAWKSQFLSGLMFPFVNFIGNLNYVAVAVLGGYLAVKGRLQIGDIQAFIQYVQQFNQPLVQTANIANVMQSTAAAAERVFEFLAEPEEETDKESSAVIQKPSGQVEFNNVVFGYDEDKVIIKGFNAKVKPGARVAIVGPTGAGKTTMVNLLMRFYEVNKGSIKIDGVNIHDMKRNDVRKMFGMVLQDTWLFNGTIKDNIAYGNPKATEQEIIEAATAAHADHFIKALPQSYNFKLNEEADNVSAGEKQLLTIARAMLAKTPMLILDEATSSVDTRTEQLIQKAMENLMKNKTSFVIAHRLSTIRDADLILVMDEGSIVEQGTHEELLKKEGFYASLYNSQFLGAEL
jgi:ATP-binding cassette subfamily B protein